MEQDPRRGGWSRLARIAQIPLVTGSLILTTGCELVKKLTGKEEADAIKKVLKEDVKKISRGKLPTDYDKALAIARNPSAVARGELSYSPDEQAKEEPEGYDTPEINHPAKAQPTKIISEYFLQGDELENARLTPKEFSPKKENPFKAKATDFAKMRAKKGRRGITAYQMVAYDIAPFEEREEGLDFYLWIFKFKTQEQCLTTATKFVEEKRRSILYDPANAVLVFPFVPNHAKERNTNPEAAKNTERSFLQYAKRHQFFEVTDKGIIGPEKVITELEKGML
jgi:hypothetical protein